MRHPFPILATLRSAAWLTPERLRVYPALIGAAFLLAILGLVGTGHGLLDHWGRPLGVDFSGIWVAGQAVLRGHPALPYDNAAHAAAQGAAFGPSDSFLPWPYPPYFLVVAGCLAGLPYLAALAVWQGGTMLLYLAAVLRAVRGAPIARRDVLVAALAFPAVAINLFHGQNGFLSTGLIAFGGLLLPRRPLVAGLCLGLLVYKPQFALAVPVALVAGAHWRALAATSVTILVLTIGTWLAFGAGPWEGFMASLGFTRRVILEGGGLESWKLQSAFAAVRLLGGSVPLAYGIQGAVGVGALCSLGRVWHSDVDPRCKVAALILASLLTTPYAVDYDMVLLGPAIAALVALGLDRGFAPWQRSLLAAVWAMPLVARGVALTLHVPIGLLVTGTLYLAVCRMAHAGRRKPATEAALAPTVA